jgi:hypothetical protein
MDHTTLARNLQAIQVAVESQQQLMETTDFCWPICMRNARIGTELDRSQKVCFSNCVVRSIDAERMITQRVLVAMKQSSTGEAE